MGGGSSAYRGSGGDVEPYTGKRLTQVVGESREELMSPVHLAGEIIQEGVVALPAMAMTTRSATLTATAHGKEGGCGRACEAGMASLSRSGKGRNFEGR